MHREHISLVKECNHLEAKNSMLKEAYEHLVERVPACSSKRLVLKHEDYPNITYWFCHEYLSVLAEDRITCVNNAPVKVQGAEHNEADNDNDGDGEDGIDPGVHEQSSGAQKGKRGKGQASQGQNVKMCYIQYENGDIIDGWRAMDIRHYARLIFVGFVLEGRVFHSWVEGVDAASRTSYYRNMMARFPEVGLCELDWKSEQIASEIYSQWRGHWVSKQETEHPKDKISSKRLVEQSSKDDCSHKRTRVLKLRSKSPVLLPVDSSLANSSHVDRPDSAPQINIITDTPSRPAQATGHVTAGSQFLAADLAIPPPDVHPQYQFSINKPFPATPSLLAPSSFLPSANPIHPAQGPSNLEQHHFGSSGNELPQEDTRKASKQPNKMQANKYSIAPRNLCAKEWVEKYHGMVEEFAAYFSALPATELEHFKALSKSLSSEKAA